jgi:hypothetical protein
MFNPVFEKFGVIKVENTRIKIYKDNYNHQMINVNAPVSHALWNSGVLTVYLMNGEVRRYRDHYYYDNVRF